MNKSVNRKKYRFLKIFLAVVITLIILGAAYLFILIKINSRRQNTNDELNSRAVLMDTTVGMTSAERLADYDSFCDFLEKNVPVLYEYDELYGIKYNDIKAYYRKLIKETQSDFEFYVTMNAFVNNLPSCHITVSLPNSKETESLFYKDMHLNTTYKNAQAHWESVLSDEFKKCYDDTATMVVFANYSGKYSGISEPVDNDVYGVNRAELISIDGISPDEFIKLKPLSDKLKYDHVRQKPFRDVLYFNDKFGEECTVEYRTADGEIRSEKLCLDVKSDYLLRYSRYLKALDTPNSEQSSEIPKVVSDENYVSFGDFTAYRDVADNTLIVYIDSFNNSFSNGVVMMTTVEKMSDGLDNIIVDLRKNRGGYFNYASDFIPVLSDKEITVNYDIFRTKESIRRNGVISDYTWDKERGMYKINQSFTSKGRAKEKKNVYLLVSDDTASAADWTASVFKRNKLGTVIGTNNTRGECNGMIYASFLEQSGISFTYPEFSSFNEDGSSNAAYGTAPDIYVNCNNEDYFIRTRLQKENADMTKLENRLEYDSIMRQTLEIIKNDEEK